MTLNDDLYHYYSVTPAGSGVLISTGSLDGHEFLTCNIAVRDDIYQRCDKEGVEIHLFDCDPETLAHIVDYHRVEYQRKAMIERVVDYFEPLFEKAIQERDRDRIRELYFQFPLVVERSFILDRLRYGRDKFDDLDWLKP